MNDTTRLLTGRLARGGLAALTVTLLATPATAQMGRALGVDTTNFDRSVRPQDDFFRFVNGGWLRSAKIPDDASSWGAFNELRENSRNALHTILDESVTWNAPAGSERRKIADLYASFLDSARVESLGLTPIDGELRTIAALASPAQLPATFAHFARIGVSSPLSVGVSPDPKHSSVNTVIVNQSGLGLPDRDYYLQPDARMSGVRQVTRDTSRSCSPWPARRTPPAPPLGSSPWRRRSPGGTGTARGAATATPRTIR